LLIQAGNPADGARRDNGLEGVMRQAMAKMGFVEHAKAFRADAPAVTLAADSGKRASDWSYFPSRQAISLGLKILRVQKGR
jgi:hypothetical protein